MSNDMNPKAKARLEKDMARLRKQMKDLGKQLERDHGMKDFDPLKNMNPKYPFNIIPDKNKPKETPFGPHFPFGENSEFGKNQQSQAQSDNQNPFGPNFPFNQSSNPFGENNPFFENLFRNSNAHCFTPPPGFMENGFRFTPQGFSVDPSTFKQFRPQPNPFTGQFPDGTYYYDHPAPTFTPAPTTYQTNGPIIEEIESSDEDI